MHFVSHKFRPPKLNDKKSWDVAVLLISTGFCYQTVRDKQGIAVDYPVTLSDARIFVAKYSPDPMPRTVRRKHDIEKQIIELESRERNNDRDAMIRKLRSDLDALS